MVGVNVDNPLFDFGTFRNTYWQFKHFLAIIKIRIFANLSPLRPLGFGRWYVDFYGLQQILYGWRNLH